LLKADCKGCEYYIIEDDAISRFDKVKIEYTGFNRPKVDYIIGKLKSRVSVSLEYINITGLLIIYRIMEQYTQRNKTF
jgi:hypothetical protein